MNKIALSKISIQVLLDLAMVNNFAVNLSLPDLVENINDCICEGSDRRESQYGLCLFVPRVMTRKERELHGLIEFFDNSKITYTKILQVMTGKDIKYLRNKYVNIKKIDRDYTFVFQKEVFCLPFEMVLKNVRHYAETNSGIYGNLYTSLFSDNVRETCVKRSIEISELYN